MTRIVFLVRKHWKSSQEQNEITLQQVGSAQLAAPGSKARVTGSEYGNEGFGGLGGKAQGFAGAHWMPWSVLAMGGEGLSPADIVVTYLLKYTLLERL